MAEFDPRDGGVSGFRPGMKVKESTLGAGEVVTTIDGKVRVRFSARGTPQDIAPEMLKVIK